MSDKKIIISLLVILICLNIIGGVIFIQQQRKMQALVQGRDGSQLLAGGILNHPEIGEGKEASTEIHQQIDADSIQQMKENQKMVTGVIKEINGSAIILSAMIENYDGINGKNPRDPQNIPVENKDIKITFDNSTEFINKEISNLKKDDTLVVSSNESISGKNEFTASSVKYLEMVPGFNLQKKN